MITSTVRGLRGAPGDRALTADRLTGSAATVWEQVGTGVPTLLEVAGLLDPEAADVDLPLLAVVEGLLDDLLSSAFSLDRAEYDDTGSPTGTTLTARPGDAPGNPLIVHPWPARPRARTDPRPTRRPELTHRAGWTAPSNQSLAVAPRSQTIHGRRWISHR
jgi:hypothetical protein